MIIKQLSVFVENKAGRVAAIIEGLGKCGVDISALSLADTTDFGIMRLIVDDPQKAMKALRDQGVIFKMTDVITVSMEDHPGGLAAVLAVLNEAEMAINYMYAFIGRQEGKAMMVFSVDQPEEVNALLTEKGFAMTEV